MTIDEQLREMARRAEEEHGQITVEEIVARASGQDGTRFLDPFLPPPAWRHRRQWFLAAAAVITAVGTIGLLAVDADNDPDSDSVGVVTDRTRTDSTTPSALEAYTGAIAFAADAGAGEALTDPIEYRRVELMPEPMDIYLARAGEPTRRLVSSGDHERCPAFSPDGKRLAYLSVPPRLRSSSPDADPPLDATLVILRLDGTIDPSNPEHRVSFTVPGGYGVRNRIGNPCPQWSPDGSRLAYLAQPAVPSNVFPDVFELRVVTLDGQEETVTQYMAAFAWSPSGEAIAFLKDGGVWLATLDGRAPSLHWQPDGSPAAVSWSARGELAVTLRTEIPVAGGSRDEYVVHVVDTDGGSEPVGVTNFGWDRSASWSPDGTRLAFVEGREIVLHDRDDGSTVRLPPPVIDGRTVGFCDVAWSANGEQLLVLAHAVEVSRWGGEDRAFMEARGMGLLSLSTDGTLIDVLTPWSWAFDWTNLDDMSSYPSE